MSFRRTDFTLFWTLPPDGVDWQNLALARVRRMQLVAALAGRDLLLRLRDAGVQGVTVRMNEEDYATHEARLRARDRIAPLLALGVDIVIVGVEPEHAFDFRYNSPGWGQDAAFAHSSNLREMLGLLRPLGVRVASPGWTSRAKDMNWREGLFPGEQTWLEITREVYNACDLNGFHWYSYDGTDYDVRERMRRTLWQEQERRHLPIYIDEVGVDRGTPVQRMGIYLHLATLLLDSTSNQPFALSGARVAALTPFVSNGNGVGWDIRYLIRDPMAYQMVGRFLSGENF